MELSSVHMASLEKFNADLCDTIDRLHSLVQGFSSWFSPLDSIYRGLTEIFESPPTISAANSSAISLYLETCRSTSALLTASVTELIGDRFTTGQVTQIRELFAVFSDISKIYMQFRPNFVQNLSSPVDRIPKILNHKFSKILTELGESVDAEPSELILLNLLPISFPRHMISYSLLFCQLVDLHHRMVFAEYSEKSRRELFAVYTKFPYPGVLLGWPEFRDLVDDQNALIRGVREFRAVLRPRHERLAEEVKGLSSAWQEFQQLELNDVVRLREQSSSTSDQLLDASGEVEQLTEIQGRGFARQAFDCPSLSFSDHRADADALTDFKTKLLVDLDQLVFCRTCLTQGRQETTRARFASLLAEIASLAAARGSALMAIPESLAAASALPTVTDLFCRPEVVSFHAVVLPSVTNLDRMIETLKGMIAEKRQTSTEIYDRIRSRRIEADRLGAVAESVKQRANNPEGQCRTCEEGRVFVLAKCGHSFCERCVNRFHETRMQRCPYAECSVAFSPEDVLRINWE
jgi:hypothetical protein